MARLNVKRAIENGRKLIKSRYDMSMNDTKKIIDMSLDDWDMVCNGFNFGYMQGYKAAMNEIKRMKEAV
ncbi:MAG: hypothetical protein PUC12_04725 [Clostridiales bacterium]|nr:hypothetical protein [Clostridiales bacterium]